MFGSKTLRGRLSNFFPVNILGNLTEVAGNLVDWFNSDLSIPCHVKNICKACFVHIKEFKQLRGYISLDATLLVANTLVGKLQCVQNSLARMVDNTTKYSHITPVKNNLHWLPVRQCSVSLTALLVSCTVASLNFESLLKPSVYNTRRSQSDDVPLEIPYFASIGKYTKHFIAFHMMLQRFRMIMYTQSILSLHLEVCKSIHNLVSGLVSVILCGTYPCYVSGLLIMELCFMVI